MEVDPKQLHKHAIPLIGGLIIVSLFSSMIIASLGSSAGKALVTQVTHINPGSNGLAHVSFESPQVKLGDDIHQTGQDVQHTLVMDLTAKDLSH